MQNRNGNLALTGYRRHWPEYWHHPAVWIVLQVLFLLGMGALASFGKSLSPGLGIPGSSAPLWLAPLILGRTAVRRDGAGVLMGLSVALWGLPMGLNNGISHNLWLYGLTGFALDIAARLPKVLITTWLGALICGVIAHLVKFGFILSASVFSPTTKHFLLVGTLQSLSLHIVFGAISGLVAWGIYRVYKSARSKPATNNS
jgi:hypothetical protein